MSGITKSEIRCLNCVYEGVGVRDLPCYHCNLGMGSENKFMNRHSSVFPPPLPALKCDYPMYNIKKELSFPDDADINAHAKAHAYGKSFSKMLEYSFIQGAEFVINEIKKRNYGN